MKNVNNGDDTRLNASNIASSAFLVALGTFSSRILGFFRDILITYYFSRTATDVFYAAFRLPNMFRRLFGEGALTISFVPVFSDFLTKDDKKAAREFVASVFTLLFVVLTTLTVVGIVFMEPVVGTLTRGFSAIPGKLELTVHQARILFGYVFLVSMYAFVMGVLNTLKIFWLPAMAPALWNLTMVLGMLFFRGRFEIESDVLAWAAIVGGVVQVGILLPTLKKVGFFPRFRKWWGEPAVWRVLKTMGPGILGLSVVQVTVIVNTYFASLLEEGSNSWIFLADRLLELPLSLFAVSLGTVALPTLSALYSKGDKKGMAAASTDALRLALFLAAPCAAGLIALGGPIIDVLFGRGRFSDYDVAQTAQVVQIYGFGIIFIASIRVIAPAFYAMKNTWLPALAAIVALTVHVFVAPVLMEAHGVVGLASSSVISSLINLCILAVAYQFMVAPFKVWELGFAKAKFFVGAYMVYLSGQVHRPLIHALGEGGLGKALALGASILVGVIVYGCIMWIFSAPELKQVLGVFMKRFRR